MAKLPVRPVRQDDVAPPPSYPQTPPPPPPAQHGHDFTLQAVMQMQGTLGALCTKVDRLIEDQGKLSEKVSALDKSFDRFRIGVIVAAAVLSIVGSALWWLIGDRIKVSVQSGIDAVMANRPATVPAPSTSPPPKN